MAASANDAIVPSSKFTKRGVPTAAECAEAEKFLEAADKVAKNKKIRSKMECMKDWARTNLNPSDCEDVLNSRGPARMQYLKEHIVQTMKEKGVMKTTTLSEEHSNSNESRDTVYEWNSEVMKQKLGPERATILMALPETNPKKLTWVKCPYTGSCEDPLRIWLVPVHLTVASNLDKNKHLTAGQTEAEAADLEKFDPHTEKDGKSPPKIAIKKEIFFARRRSQNTSRRNP